jgi:protein SCO1
VNGKALVGILIALVIPLGSYFILKSFSDTAISMPRPVYYDTVLNKVEGGKRITDTVWHRVPDFTFTNQAGKKVSSKDLYVVDERTGDTTRKIIVANFFFTNCATICPRMTMNIKRLQESITNTNRVGDKSPDFIQFISFTVDPDRDSVRQLKKWTDRFQINPENWWFVTGDKKAIYDLSINDMKLWAQDPHGVDTSFVHTDVMVLIDKDRVVRMARDEFGNPRAYNALDTADLAKLSEDIIFLTLEKDKKKKSFLAGKLELIAVVFLLTILGLGIFFMVLRKVKMK